MVARRTDKIITVSSPIRGNAFACDESPSNVLPSEPIKFITIESMSYANFILRWVDVKPDITLIKNIDYKME